MHRRQFVLFTLLIACLTSPADGQQIYSNFPVSGLISAFQVSGGDSASESFTLAGSATIGEAAFGAWLTRGDSVRTVSWSIGTMPYDSSFGSGVAGATSAYMVSNADGFDVDTVTFAIPSITLAAGTYYLTLSSAESAEANAVYWDINDAGVGDAWTNTNGHVSTSGACFNLIGISGTCASSFQLLSTSTALSASPTSLTFSSQTVGTTSSAQNITITNNSASAATITGIGLSGANAGDFAQTNNCPISPNTLAANGVCAISVTFTPLGSGARLASITLTGSSPLSVGLSGTGVAAGPTPWPNGYGYEATFTVNSGQAPSAQTNFPVLISGTWADFATTGNGGRINNTCTQTVGTRSIATPCDLIFTSDAAGTMPLSWEFETWNATSGAVNIWVNVPSLSNGAVVYAWYGQASVTTLQTTPSSTWSDSFEAVYHLSESVSATATQLNDSTANANNGTLSGTVQASQQQAGEIGGSVNFAGNTWAGLANAANFNFERTNSFSISGWFKLASNAAGTLLAKIPAAGQGGWALLQEPNGGNPAFTLDLAGASGTSAVGEGVGVTTGVWHNLVLTYSGTSTVAGMEIYVDGVSQTVKALINNLNASILNSLPAAINGRDGPNQETGATMDELRVSTAGTVFSAGYVTTSYNNQANPAAFFTVATGLLNSAPLPSVTLSSSSISFPNQTVNTTSAAQTFTITNSGPGTLAISSIGITGAGMADFAQTNNCPISPNTIAVNGTCTVNVTFTPQTANTFTAAVTITDNGASSPQSVSLSGTGIPVPSTVMLSSSSISFPNQTVNTTSMAQTFTITNSGPNTLAISSIAVTGASMADFAQTNNCPISPNTIAVNGMCTVNVTFTPQTANTFTAAVTITDNGAGSPQSVNLSGTGTPVPSTVMLSSSSISFPNQTVNTTSTAQTFTIMNSGPNTLAINSIGITGAGMADFAQTNNCPISPNTIAVNGTCMVNVTFTPQTANTFTAAVTVTDNGASSPQSVSLSGTGIPVPSTVMLSSSSISFPNQTVNTTSAAQTFTITNSGPNTLAISSIAVTGAGTADFAQTNNCLISPNTIAVNGMCTVNVTFTPQTANTFTAAVTITDNGAGSPQSVGLSGTGAAAGPTPWPNGYGYEATFTVNSGQVPSTQSNFPVLISGTWADFATTGNGGRINNTCTQTVGSRSIATPCDLIFTSDAAGTMPLSWEFETWNASSGAVNIWVNVPSLSNGAVVYAWYGQASVTTLQTTPSSTWSNSFEAVYHLSESVSATATQLNDSTANANNGTLSGTVQASQQQAGEIGGSVNFAGNTWAGLANAANFNFERTNSFSISGWFKLASNAAGTLLSKIPAAPQGGWALLQEPNGGNPAFTLDLASASGTSAVGEGVGVTTGVWHNLVLTYSGTSTVAGMEIYVDGVSQTVKALINNLNASILNSLPAAINGRDGPNQETAATMDELRVSTAGTVFSAGYVTTSYNNQANPAAFFTVATGLTN